jgi:hypothetical protein
MDSAKRPFGEMDSAKHPFGETSVRRNVHSAKRPFGETSVRRNGFGEMEFGETDSAKRLDTVNNNGFELNTINSRYTEVMVQSQNFGI